MSDADTLGVVVPIFVYGATVALFATVAPISNRN